MATGTDYTLLYKVSRIIPHTSVPLDQVAIFSSLFLFVSQDLFLYFTPPAETAQSQSYNESVKQFVISLN